MSEQAAVRVCDYKGGVTPNISYLDMSVAHVGCRSLEYSEREQRMYIIAHRTCTGNF